MSQRVLFRLSENADISFLQSAPPNNGLKRKRGASSTAPPTEEGDSEKEELVSENEVEFDEDAELQDSSDSDFQASDYDEVDGSESESDEDYAPLKSPRKSFVKVEPDAGSDSEAEAQMIGLAIGMSKETLREEQGRRLGGAPGPSSSSASELRAAAAERRLSSGFQVQLPDDWQEDDMSALSAEDDEPLSSKGKAKSKGKGKASKSGPKKMTMAELRRIRREEARKARADKRLTKNYVKQEERALALKLGRRLTHAERTTIALRRCHPELTTVWEDLESYVKPVRTQKAEQPEELKVDLLPFQLESLHWMREQEKGEWTGGMLAVSTEISFVFSC